MHATVDTGTHPRVVLYNDVLRGLRLLMIERMVKPEEVLITADEHGNVVRDVFRDTDTLQQQYKTMRETLVYLSHLDYANTEEQMLEKLRQQLSGQLQWDRLNTLCWVRTSVHQSRHVYLTHLCAGGLRTTMCAGCTFVTTGVWVHWPECPEFAALHSVQTTLHVPIIV